ncbi:MAG: protein kinase [Myxococcota bacterium]
MSDLLDSADEEHPLIGETLDGRYQIEALLGRGGMGAVFRARHLSLDRPVAVKLLHPQLSSDPRVGKRFDREAQAVSKLDHPGCVQVMDFGTSELGIKYLVMQFLDGHELRDRTGVGLEISEAVDIVDQVLDALEHAHKRGLVHRDLKPENIFLVRDDDHRQVVKLVDFGIVKLLEGNENQERLTQLGMAFGTPTYMSPEQAAGGTIDARTDIYAVGVLLYELLTGAPPFDADEPGILLRMHILRDPPPLPDTIPPSIVAVVMKLLAKEAEDRYLTAREAQAALREAVENMEAQSDSGAFPRLVPPGPGAAAPPPPAARPTHADAAGLPPSTGPGLGHTPPTDPAAPTASNPTPAPPPHAAVTDPALLATAANPATPVAGMAAPPPHPASSGTVRAPPPGPLPTYGPNQSASFAHGPSGAHAPWNSGAGMSAAHSMTASQASLRKQDASHRALWIVVSVAVLAILVWVGAAIYWMSPSSRDLPAPAASPDADHSRWHFTDGVDPASAKDSEGSDSTTSTAASEEEPKKPKRKKERKGKGKKDKKEGKGK